MQITDLTSCHVHHMQYDIIDIAQSILTEEISALQQLIVNDADKTSFKDAVEIILTTNNHIILIGLGKSGHIAHKIAATLSSTGTPAFFLHAAEALHGDLGMITRQNVVIIVSYSGESDEITAILPTIKQRAAAIIAITGNNDSTLTKHANCTLNINVNKEACPLNLAPTASTTNMLVLGDMLALTLSRLRNFQESDFASLHPGGSLGRRLLKVSDIMCTGERIPRVLVTDNLVDIITQITKNGMGFTAVVDDTQNVIGVITDGDLRRHFTQQQDLNLVAKDIMTFHPKTLSADDLALQAIALMQQYSITGFIVVDEQNKLVGAFNIHSLLKNKII
jgi:arabinose-5-phosphate isomerase